MSTGPNIERAEAYINVHLAHSGPAGEAHPAGPFVTLSRECGTGGMRLAQALAERLQRTGDGHAWCVYGGNLIEEMLRTNQLPPQLARFLPEDRVSEFDASVGELVGLHPNLWVLTAKSNELMRRLARAGHAILVGRGANFATGEIDRGVHVRLVASEGFRAGQTARRLSLPLDAAREHNLRRDAARQRYVRATFGADIADAAVYTVVLNVEHLSVECMAAFVASLVGERQHARDALARHR
jgi:hypothetical protein